VDSGNYINETYESQESAGLNERSCIDELHELIFFNIVKYKAKTYEGNK